jgi:hypothetical protein
MWQIAMSADDTIAATGSNSGAKSYLALVPAARAAADITTLSVRMSPVATRLNDRKGGVNRTAGWVTDAVPDSETAVAPLTIAVAAQAHRLKDTTRATRPLTPWTLLAITSRD